MSQLYQLFCEGLTSGQDLLSSTVIGVTSTPGEDNDAVAIADIIAPPTNAVVNSSIDAQVGSAESPDGGTQSPEDARAPPPADSDPGLNKNPDEVRLLPKDKTLGDPSAAKQAPTGNVSPVDFIDRIIAVKRRDEALREGGKKRKSQDSVSNEESPVPQNQATDSSETDFEGAGAAEYFEKYPVASTSGNGKNVVAHKENEKVSSPSQFSDESVITLSLQQITDSGSSSHDEASRHPSASFTAARCRVYQKKILVEQKQTEKENFTGTDDNADVASSQKSVPEPVLEKETSGSKKVSDKPLLSSVLTGVVAYVEVRSGHDNRSYGVRSHLRAHGATVLKKFCKEVTHVVFNEGSPSLLRRARAQGCHIVSVLWIEACKTLGHLAPEADFPPLNMHIYERTETMFKYRKMKSMQPDFEESEAEERLKKYMKRYRRKQPQVLSQRNESLSSESGSSETEEEDQPVLLTEPRHGTELPPGMMLKPVTVVLHKLNTDNLATSTSVLSQKKSKRRLMPLRGEILDSTPIEDFNPKACLRPDFPFMKASTSKMGFNNRHQRRSNQVLNSSQSRRSSCFMPRRPGSAASQYRQKKMKAPMRTMVCTFMHRRDIDVVAAVLKQLGGWILEPTVSAKTTHVVCGDGKRTINLLRGIAHGCWILHQEWVMRSLEAGYWLDEEPFELTIFPAIQQCRVARETLGIQPDIFNSVGAIFVSKETTPPRSDLLDLLELCGAQLAKSPRQAKIIVGSYQKRASYSDFINVREQWVLDSIQENMLQPTRNYRFEN